MEMTAGDGGEFPRPEHFDGADGTRTKNGMHPGCEYKNVVSEATERGQASMGDAEREDNHGALEISEEPGRAEEGRGHRGHDDQVSSGGDRGELCGARRGARDAESEEWSVGSNDESDEETEEEGMPAGGLEGREDTLTALP